MADNLNIFNRLKHIDEILSTGRKICTTDLCRAFGVDPEDENRRRNFQKDIVLLEDYCQELGIELDVSYLGRTKYVQYRNPAKTIFRRELESGERALLSEMMHLVLQFDGLPNKESIDSLSSKLGITPSDHKAISLSENPLTFDAEHFRMMFSAIVDKGLLEIDYRPFGKEAERYILSPYLLKEYNRRWFLLGSDAFGKLRTLALDRIERVTAGLTSSQVHYQPCEIDWEDYFDDIIGVTRYEDREAVEILFWVSNRSLPYVERKDIHSSMKYQQTREAELRALYPTLEGGKFFTIRCIPNYELYRELASFGENLIVLSPLEIQDQVFATLDKMRQRYLDIRPTSSP